MHRIKAGVNLATHLTVRRGNKDAGKDANHFAATSTVLHESGEDAIKVFHHMHHSSLPEKLHETYFGHQHHDNHHPSHELDLQLHHPEAPHSTILPEHLHQDILQHHGKAGRTTRRNPAPVDEETEKCATGNGGSGLGVVLCPFLERIMLPFLEQNEEFRRYWRRRVFCPSVVMQPCKRSSDVTDPEEHEEDDDDDHHHQHHFNHLEFPHLQPARLSDAESEWGVHLEPRSWYYHRDLQRGD